MCPTSPVQPRGALSARMSPFKATSSRRQAGWSMPRHAPLRQVSGTPLLRVERRCSKLRLPLCAALCASEPLCRESSRPAKILVPTKKKPPRSCRDGTFFNESRGPGPRPLRRRSPARNDRWRGGWACGVRAGGRARGRAPSSRAASSNPSRPDPRRSRAGWGGEGPLRSDSSRGPTSRSRPLWRSNREDEGSPGSGLQDHQDPNGSEDRSASWLPLSVALGASVPSW